MSCLLYFLHLVLCILLRFKLLLQFFFSWLHILFVFFIHLRMLYSAFVFPDVNESSMGRLPEQRMKAILQEPESAKEKCTTWQPSPLWLQRVILKGKPSQQLIHCNQLPSTVQKPDGHVEAKCALYEPTQPSLQLHIPSQELPALSDQLPSTSGQSFHTESSSPDVESTPVGTSSSDNAKDYIKTSIEVKSVRVAGKRGIKRKRGNIRQVPARKMCRMELPEYRKDLSENMVETSKMMMNTVATEVCKSLEKGTEALNIEISKRIDKGLGPVAEMSKTLEKGLETIATEVRESIDQLGDRLVGAIHVFANAVARVQTE